jgi:hypothetical protein
VTSPGGDGAGEAEALWSRCEADWEERARHEAFIQHCLRAELLGFAAARYRAAGDRTGAAERLAQIRVLAEQWLAARAASRPPPARRSRMGIVAVVLAVGAAAYWLTP